MSVRYGKAGQDAQLGAQSSVADTVRAGLIGGFVGAVAIWIYEAVVWVGAQHLMPLSTIPSNATGLVFGKNVQEFTRAGSVYPRHGNSFGLRARLGVLFAFIWPFFRRRGFEATLVALLLCRGGLDRHARRDRGRLLEPSEPP